MRRSTLCTLAALLGFILLPAAALGHGFLINELDTKAFSMGGAFVAQADNPSAVYFNPAGMVELDGTQMSAGFSIILPSFSFKSNGTSAFGQAGEKTDAKDQTFFIPNIYLTHKLNDQWSLGLGGFSNFGLSTQWPDDWEGRFITGGTEASLVTGSINPVVAFRPTEKVSLGGGIVAQYVDITLKNKRFLGLGAPEADVKLSGDNWGWGWNLSLMLWLTEELKFGASYRSRIKQEIDGKTEITGLGALGLSDIKRDTSADIELPDIVYLGLAWSRGPWTLEFDGQWTGWSSYDELAADFDQPIFGSTGISSDKNWKDVWAYRFGANYRLNDNWDLRAGIVYDESPIPDETFDPLVPSGDRWLYALGLGYNTDRFTIDFGYNYLDDESRVFDNEAGDYNQSIAPGLGQMTGKFVDVYSHLFMINFIYRF